MGDADALFACLADSRRRALIRSIAEESTPLGIEDLTHQICRREGDPVDESDGAARREIRISLVHCHLPKLADARILEVDTDANAVERGPRFTTARTSLELL